MDKAQFACREVGRIGLGTWSMGGWMWGESADEEAARATLRRAIAEGVDLIDTAPVYGFGLSERLVRQVLDEAGVRGEITVVTKFGMVWDSPGGPTRKDASFDNALRECEESLSRLGTDRIDVYLLHWPEPGRPVAEAARAAGRLLEQGLVSAIGACNLSAEQYAEWLGEAPLHVAQFRFNLFERAAETDGVVDFCSRHGVATMAYSPLARGLLSGTMTAGHEATDSARRGTMFHGEEYRRHLREVQRIDSYARERHGRGVLPFAMRWVLERPGITTALWGARRPEQLDSLGEVFGWRYGTEDDAMVASIVA